jgi:Flp pilus assembly protein protease CpaA
MFRQGTLGGGDVKLFAAFGAIGGFSLGMEAQFFTLVAAVPLGVWAVVRRGIFAETLRNSGRYLLSLVSPRGRQREVTFTEASAFRLGIAILAGAIVAAIRDGALR